MQGRGKGVEGKGKKARAKARAEAARLKAGLAEPGSEIPRKNSDPVLTCVDLRYCVCPIGVVVRDGVIVRDRADHFDRAHSQKDSVGMLMPAAWERNGVVRLNRLVNSTPRCYHPSQLTSSGVPIESALESWDLATAALEVHGVQLRGERAPAAHSDDIALRDLMSDAPDGSQRRNYRKVGTEEARPRKAETAQERREDTLERKGTKILKAGKRMKGGG